MTADESPEIPLKTSISNKEMIGNNITYRNTLPLDRSIIIEDDITTINNNTINNNNNNRSCSEVILSNIELEDMKTDVKEHLHPASTCESGYGMSGSIDESGGVNGVSGRARKKKSIRRMMKRCMKSRRLHVIVVILVILDSICVSVELIVDLIVTVYHQYRPDEGNLNATGVFSNNRSNQSSGVVGSSSNPVIVHPRTLLKTSPSLSPSFTSSSSSSSINRFNLIDNNYNSNSPHSSISTWSSSSSLGLGLGPGGPLTPPRKSDEYLWSFISDMNLTSLSILISIETFFKYFGLIILSLFVLEIMCKIIFIPRELIRSKWGIFDAIVVFTSFILDVILLKDKKILHTVSGLITLFR